MPGVKCGGCGRFISTIDGAKCGKCQAQYHRVCVGVPTKTQITANWRCPECKKGLARDNRAETPVRGSAGSSSGNSAEQTPVKTSTPVNPAICAEPTSPSRNPTPPPCNTEPTSPSRDATLPPYNASAVDVTAREISQIAGSDMSLILEELRAVRAEIQVFRKEMEMEMMELKASMTTCNTRIDSLESRVDALEQRASSGPTNTVAVDRIVEDLRRELNDRDQDLLANDIEVSNIPEAKVDSPIHIIKVISQKLGVNLEERDIVSAERVGGRQLNATSSAGATESRPRPIVVRLARRDLRDDLLASARVRRGATTADLDMPGPAQRFFVNERLTKTNRQLFRRARDAAGISDWRFVWTKRGRILARRKPGDPTHRIRTDEDIASIFGPVNKTT